MAQKLRGQRRCDRFKEILRSHPAASVAALEKVLEVLAQKSTMPWQIARDELAVAAPVVDGPQETPNRAAAAFIV